MMEQRKIELDSYEQTAYWWIRMLRKKINELYIYKIRIGVLKREEEEDFLSIFENFSEKDWRNLYIKLSEYIAKDVDDYVPRKNIIADRFEQDTMKEGHQRLNEELSDIVGKKVPDIRLSINSEKDYIISTDTYYSYEWYKSCGVKTLERIYNCSYNYVLTGDEEELDFYNLLLATCICVSEKRPDFNSIYILKDIFCNEYDLYNNFEKNINNLFEEFNKVFMAFQGRIDISKFWEEKYRYYDIKDIDKNGLDSYMDQANKIASIIIREFDNQNQNNISLKKTI